jgi:hypothetical protein
VITTRSLHRSEAGLNPDGLNAGEVKDQAGNHFPILTWDQAENNFPILLSE